MQPYWLKTLLEIAPRFFRCFRLLNIVEHVIMDTGCKAIQHTACGLLPFWVVDVCWVGLRFVSSFYIALVTLSDKVLMYLVLTRRGVCSIELLCRKSASHLSVHDVNFFSIA